MCFIITLKSGIETVKNILITNVGENGTKPTMEYQ